MGEKYFLGVVLLAICVAIGAPTVVTAAGPANEMTQFDVAHEIYQAVDVNDESATAAQAMLALQAHGLVPQSWNGREVVTMAEVGQVMTNMGIEVGISNPSDSVGVKDLEQLLDAHKAEIDMVGSDWDNDENIIIPVFGDRQRRIISSSGF